MKYPKHGIIAEDIAAIGRVALPTVYGHIHLKGFPKPLGKFLGRFVWDSNAVRRFYETRIDGRTTLGHKRRLASLQAKIAISKAALAASKAEHRRRA